MSIDQLTALLPFIVLTVTSLVVMLVIAFYRNHLTTAVLTCVGLVLAFGSLWAATSRIPLGITPLMIMDGYAPFFVGLIIASCFVTVLLSYDYLENRTGQREEYYLLILLVALGAAVVTAARHFASFFLGLEILTVAFYALIAYQRENPAGIEAGIKYLILSAVSDAFLLFGMALIYSQCGTMEFTDIAEAAFYGNQIILVSGTTLMIVGIGFKLSVVPFHMWAPDVYQGAPAPITGLLATVSKVAVFALLVRYFAEVDIPSAGTLVSVFTVIAFTSMIVGNILALLQNNVKRILAYSSIAHIGYLLVAFLAGGETALTATAYYLTAYAVTTLGAFGVVTMLSAPDRDAERLADYRGLAWRKPWTAAVFTIMLLSLAGIPLTAGFIGKFYVMAVGIESSLLLLVMTLVATSIIGLFYYLRIVITMYLSSEPTTEEPVASGFSQTWASGTVLVILTGLLIWWGVYPSPLIDIIERTVGKLV